MPTTQYKKIDVKTLPRVPQIDDTPVRRSTRC